MCIRDRYVIVKVSVPVVSSAVQVVVPTLTGSVYGANSGNTWFSKFSRMSEKPWGRVEDDVGSGGAVVLLYIARFTCRGK